MASGRFINGFLHAYVDDPYLQLSFLLIVNLVMLFVIVSNARIFQTRKGLYLCIWMLFIKALLHVCLLAEAIYKGFRSVPTDEESAFSEVTSSLVFCYVILLTMDWFFNIMCKIVWETVAWLTKMFGKKERTRHPKKIIKQIRKADSPKRERMRIHVSKCLNKTPSLPNSEVTEGRFLPTQPTDIRQPSAFKERKRTLK